jgi:hypothetical protein
VCIRGILLLSQLKKAALPDTSTILPLLLSPYSSQTVKSDKQVQATFYLSYSGGDTNLAIW